ncbi:MAG: IS110 family transposase, partial [Hydrogenophaga sp.]|nr:IS110 family transposase [Hydrogenophaga sp.]NIO15385.1 IS110 family transposase [Xanthomonadales bacterium]NIN57007.1 IS110 family transposase [Hydrogenophaga sp.]NIO54478.1 IS110 family transposase [Hydrogenophaga sp.]NIO91430.1 IS110 family transposase [Hydrogenophaga sp.]
EVHDSLQSSLAFLREQKARLERQIDDHIDRHPGLREDRDRLVSIPAVGPRTAMRVMA